MKNKDKHLMIDFDCTLVDFITPYLSWCHSHLDIDTSKFDMTEYDWPRKFIGSGCSAFWNGNKYFDSVKPFTGAVEFIKKLNWENVCFSICTIAEEEFIIHKKKMIENYFGTSFCVDIIVLPVSTQKRHSLGIGDDDSYLFIDDRKSYIHRELDVLYNHNGMHPWANDGEFNVKTSYEDLLKFVLEK